MRIINMSWRLHAEDCVSTPTSSLLKIWRSLILNFLLIAANLVFIFPMGVAPAQDPSSVAISGLSVSNDRWPRTTSAEALGADIARLIGPATPEAAAIETFNWVSRLIFADDPAPFEVDRNTGEINQVIDMIKVLNVYGHHWCSGHADLILWIWNMEGKTGRRIGAARQPHAMAELYYADRDNVERFHAFDPYLGWYLYTRDGSRLASIDEIKTSPDLSYLPSRQTHPGFYFDASVDWLNYLVEGEIIHLPVEEREFTFNHDIRWTLRPGESLVYWWRNVGKYYSNEIYTRVYEDGPVEKHLYEEIQGQGCSFPENAPFIMPYIFPTMNNAQWFSDGIPARTYGNGRFTFKPATGADLLNSLSRIPKGTQATSKGIRFPASYLTSFAYKMVSPYLIVDSTLLLRASTCPARAMVYISVLTTDGQYRGSLGSWSGESLLRGIRVNPVELLSKEDPANPYGQYGFEYVIAFSCPGNNNEIEIDDLRVENIFQQNMYALPRLFPGSNLITVDGTAPPECLADVTYSWDDQTGFHTSINRISSFPSSFSIFIDDQPQEQIRCRSLQIESLSAPLQKDRPDISKLIRRPAPRPIQPSTRIRTGTGNRR